MANTTWTQTAGMTSDEDTDNLESYAEQAEASKDAAAASETAAATSATSASASAAAALASKNAAAVSAAAASASETSAGSSASTATSKASEASTSATNAATSATSSATSATASAASATSASASESAASTSETNAATSETNAATSATAAQTAETNAETAETNAEAAQAAAEAAEANAATSETNAATSASTASTAATTATIKASEASTSASNAATSASNASASETAAAASESAAAASESAAETAKDAALAALDSFDDRYLGQKASDPTVDNDGDALVAGALYFNTSNDTMRVYEGSTWVAAYASLSGALLASNNLSDLTNAVTARSNLGLGTAATTASTDYATAAQGALADSAVQPNDSPTFAGLTTTADVSFGDNDKAIFGAGSDLQIYHDGTASYVSEAGVGALRLQGTNLQLQSSAGVNYLQGINNDRVDIYHNGSVKLATTSTGVDVTGTVTADGLTVDGNIIQSGGDEIQNSGTLRLNADYDVSGAGNVEFKTKGILRQQIANGGGISFYEDTGTTPKFFWDASAESLGIGTTSPSSYGDLTLFKSGNASTRFALANNGNGGGTVAWTMKHDTAWDLTLSHNAGIGGQNLIFGTKTSGGESMRIDSSGRVGIGTSSPLETLVLNRASLNNLLAFQLAGSSKAYMGVSSLNNGVLTGSLANDLNIRSESSINFGASGSSNIDMRIDSSGNVGIGTSSPVAPISVNGEGSQGLSAWFGKDDSFVNNASYHYADARVGISGRDSDGTDRGAGIEFTSRNTGNSNWLHGYLVHGRDGSIAFGTGGSGTSSGSERMRIDSSGNLLVGTTSNQPFNFTSGTGFAVAHDGYFSVSRNGAVAYLNRNTTDGAIVDLRKNGSTVGSIGNDGTILQISSASTGGVFLADNGTNVFGFANGENAFRSASDNTIDLGKDTRRFKDLYLSGGLRGDTLTFNNLAGSERMRIDSSGNLLVGTTDTTPYNNSSGTSADQGFVVNDGRIFAATNANSVSILNRTNSDGTIQEFRKDGSTVGSISSIAGARIGINLDPHATNGVGLTGFLNHVLPLNASGTTDGVTSLGLSSNRFKDLYLSGGVYLGGTGSANKLDDYEAGTFNPTLVASGSNPTVSYTARNGNYVKIGDSVTVHVYILLSSFSGGSGTIQIASLPFTASNTRCSGSVSYSSGFPSAPQTCLSVSNSTAITLYYFSGSSVVGVPTTDLNGNEQLRLSLTYEV